MNTIIQHTNVCPLKDTSRDYIWACSRDERRRKERGPKSQETAGEVETKRDVKMRRGREEWEQALSAGSCFMPSSGFNWGVMKSSD